MIGRALTVALGADAYHCQAHLSENLHYQADHPRVGELFVKVYADEERCRREGLVLDLLGPSHDWVIPPRYEGVLPDGEHFRAFSRHSMRPFVLDPGGCRWAGRILAELHGTAWGPSSGAAVELPPTEPGWRVIDQRLEKLRQWPEPYREAVRIAGEAAPLLRALDARAPGQVLLSGDFGARNLHVRQDNDSPVLLDFERAMLGDPHWDLGKLWDQGMSEPTQRTAFLRGYREAGGRRWFPDRTALWATRFAAASGIFPYASRVGDTAFFQHGIQKLSLLSAELPGVLATID